MARLNILSNDELDRLYTIPKIEEDELPFIFEIDEDDKKGTSQTPCQIPF